MDNQIKQTSRVKPIFAYLKDSIKFYDIDHPMTAQIIFIVQLAVVFGGYIFARPYIHEFLVYFEQFSTRLMSQVDTKTFNLSLLGTDIARNLVSSFYVLILILFVIKAVSYIINMYYGTYYYLSLTHPDMSGSERASVFFKRFPKLVAFNVLYYLTYYMAVVVLIIALGTISIFVPVIYMITPAIPLVILSLDLMFMFKNLLIIEFDVGIIRNFKKSLDLTKGCKRNIIINGLWPLCLGLLLNAFSIDIENQIMALFITAFLGVIVLLISERLSVLMFIDAASMERKRGKPQEKKSETSA